MKKAILFLIMFALYGCDQSTEIAEEPISEPRHSQVGTVLETIDVDTYIYLKLDVEGSEVWIASNPVWVSEGDVVSFTDAALMKDFRSETLDRTFESILFVNDVELVSAAAENTAEGQVVSPTVINPEVPQELSDVALKSLAKKMDDRFDDAEEMSIAIDDALASSTDRTGRAGIAHYMQNVFGEDEKTQREWINTALSPTGLKVQKTGEQWLDMVPDADQMSVFFAPDEKTASGSIAATTSGALVSSPRVKNQSRWSEPRPSGVRCVEVATQLLCATSKSARSNRSKSGSWAIGLRSRFGSPRSSRASCSRSSRAARLSPWVLKSPPSSAGRAGA